MNYFSNLFLYRTLHVSDRLLSIIKTLNTGYTAIGVCHLDVCLSVHRCICVEKKNQLYLNECFIALMIHSTCFGHFYAHHQELETVCVLLPSMVGSVWLLVVGGQVRGSRLSVQEEGCCNIPLPGLTACCPAPDPRQLATNLCTP